MPDYSPDPRTYELMTILSPDVAEDELPAATEHIGGYISGAGGELQETLTDSPWGRRRLAYSIRHSGRDVRDGFYTLYHFIIEPSRVADIERELKLNTLLMRYLMTRYEPVPPEELSEEEAEIVAEDEAAAAYAAAQAAGEAPAPATAVETTAEPDASAAPESATPEPAPAESTSDVSEVEEVAGTEAVAAAAEPAEVAGTESDALADSSADSGAEQAPEAETEEG